VDRAPSSIGIRTRGGTEPSPNRYVNVARRAPGASIASIRTFLQISGSLRICFSSITEDTCDFVVS
jgi:hypothetical protein